MAPISQNFCSSAAMKYTERRVRMPRTPAISSASGSTGRCTSISVDPAIVRQIGKALGAIAPAEIYNLSGQSSVGLSYAKPVDAFTSHAVGTLNILDSLRSLALEARLFNASSGEIFGNTANDTRGRRDLADRSLQPLWRGEGGRDAAGEELSRRVRPVCLLRLHVQPRDRRFGRRISSPSGSSHGAIDIAQGRRERLTLGNLSIVRDWGWAPDFVELHVGHAAAGQAAGLRGRNRRSARRWKTLWTTSSAASS